jgi:hypothetical protein
MIPIKMFRGAFYLHLQGSPGTVSYMEELALYREGTV